MKLRSIARAVANRVGRVLMIPGSQSDGTTTTPYDREDLYKPKPPDYRP